jgi:hypothetical protein
MKDLKLSLVTMLVLYPMLGTSLVRSTDKAIAKHFNVIKLNKHKQSFRGFVCEKK